MEGIDEFERMRAVQKLVLSALLSEENLLDRLVLKGGCAIDLVYAVGNRASLDLDFSMAGDFADHEVATMERRLERVMGRVVASKGLRLFDLHFEPRPRVVSPELAGFWGGYGILFKLIPEHRAAQIDGDIDALRRNALVVGPSQQRTFRIDISRHELCDEKEEHVIDGTSVFVYSPRLIVSEKLRAICQQHPEYRRRVKSGHATPHARDFFDICTLVERFSLHLVTREFRALTEEVFRHKRVPLNLLWEIGASREFHRADYATVLDTVPARVVVQDFDYYFDTVVELVGVLQALGNP